MTGHWLMKTEPSTFSIDDLRRRGREPWDGVRNYQARNMMRDQMRVGDGVLIYHSNCDVPAIVESPAWPATPIRTPARSIRDRATSTRQAPPTGHAGIWWTSPTKAICRDRLRSRNCAAAPNSTG